ncbi:MAG: hypothetical protein KGJ78_09935 [Alphaproteobacteria bacterium]|nr:hypothetical protein [Alphaproteobacteria bacterium]
MHGLHRNFAFFMTPSIAIAARHSARIGSGMLVVFCIVVDCGLTRKAQELKLKTSPFGTYGNPSPVTGPSDRRKPLRNKSSAA